MHVRVDVMQYEGAVEEGGRSPSIWDNFTHAFPGPFISWKVSICRWLAKKKVSIYRYEINYK